MTNPVGAYATLAAAKLRLGFTDVVADRDSLIQDFCDQVNGDLESFTGRVLAPIPTFVTTLSAPAAAAATSVTLTSVVGLVVGDPLLFGLVTGTREHAYAASISGSVVTLQTALANAYASGVAVERVTLLDGFSALDDGRAIEVPAGVVSLASVEVATYTGGPFSLIPGSDWFLRPPARELDPGWPWLEVAMTNIPSAGNTTPVFFPGYDTVRLRGQFGWSAIPPEIAGMANMLVVTLWQMRSSGGAYSTAIGGDGRQSTVHMLSDLDYRQLLRYTRDDPLII